MARTWNAPALARHKARDGLCPLAMVTAYDAPGARIADAAGVDLILVGDSVANVVLGYESTMQVTIEDLAHHTAAVARAKPTPFVVADLPWGTYHTGPSDAVRAAVRLVRAGAQAVKLEGGRNRVAVIEAIIDAEIPVMGHIGLTPQSVLAMGGHRVQGKSVDGAKHLVDAGRTLAEAGVFSIVVEGVPTAVGRAVTDTVPVPTIGIGAGPHTDGQVLVFHDLLGIEDRLRPRFVRRYAELGTVATEAMRAYAEDVRARRFPTEAESYAASEDLSAALEVY
ncbi:MAG: 3-methyl-2-oxobutanoate hydroxymethyltransferase [Acidimicrobiia bacterium]|nr:3-methyl-2-oxobutanoate hydroxymethyltransferase [Acidimicrobiia bacterium]